MKHYYHCSILGTFLKQLVILKAGLFTACAAFIALNMKYEDHDLPNINITPSCIIRSVMSAYKVLNNGKFCHRLLKFIKADHFNRAAQVHHVISNAGPV
jgi:hypothetical protein